MGYRYTNEVEGGQVIESDDVVPYLEGQALWVREVIGEPDPALTPRTHDDAPTTPFTVPDVPVFTTQESGEVIGEPDPALTPAGPDGSWTNEQIDEWAAAQQPPIDLGDARKKADKLAAIAAAVAPTDLPADAAGA